MAKHGFSENHPTKCNAIEAANKQSIFRYRNTMGMALFMKLRIGVHDFMGDPCAILIFSRGGCARANDCSEIIINTDIFLRIRQKVSNGFLQRVMALKVLRLQYHSGVG